MPEYRKVSSELAYHLKRYFENTQQDVPEIISEWEKISNNSSLPEVKKIWHFE